MRNEHLRYSLDIRDWGYIPEYEAWEMVRRPAVGNLANQIKSPGAK